MWTRRHLLDVGDWDGQVERFYLVRVPGCEPAPRLWREQPRAEHVTAVRRCTIDELEAADARCAPRRLPLLVRDLLRVTPPRPIDAGV